jgi:hypothetical protein
MGTRTECEAHPTLICDNENMGRIPPGAHGWFIAGAKAGISRGP